MCDGRLLPTVIWRSLSACRECLALPTTENQLIELLPRRERRRLLGLCKPVDLEPASILCEFGSDVHFVYFPTHSFISLLTVVDEKTWLEVGMVGREGMLGLHMALGLTKAPLRALVQRQGTALRIGAHAFQAEMASSPPLQRILARYLYVAMAQLASSAGCLRFHTIGQRLAKWLLMSQDRAQASTFRVTQGYLAYMLGVRRVGITNAALDLQRRGVIEYQRGEMTVLNRPALERASCNCYVTDRQAYDSMLS
jgi:CRP-like cAMP-binding protein